MMPQWTATSAEDVERFRQQQRGRFRMDHTTVISPEPTMVTAHPAMRMVIGPNDQGESEPRDRARKVSYRFRKEHQRFLQKHQQEQQQPSYPHPASFHRGPSGLTGWTMTVPAKVKPVGPDSVGHGIYNAFDSTTSPETFGMHHPASSARQYRSNQDEIEREAQALRLADPVDTDQDTKMTDGGDCELYHSHPSFQQDDKDQDSLWRRRFHQDRRSPKLGQVALWDARGMSANQLLDRHMIERVPHPFAQEEDL